MKLFSCVVSTISHLQHFYFFLFKDVKDVDGFETTKDKDEFTAAKDVEFPIIEDVEERKPAEDAMSLNLTKDFKELKSKLNTVDSKLKEVSYAYPKSSQVLTCKPEIYFFWSWTTRLWKDLLE